MRFIKDYFENKKAKQKLFSQVQNVVKSIVKGKANHLEECRLGAYGLHFDYFEFKGRNYHVAAKVNSKQAYLVISLDTAERFVKIAHYESRDDDEVIWENYFLDVVQDAKHIFEHYDDIVDIRIRENLANIQTVLA